jgi:hypothetical protein
MGLKSEAVGRYFAIGEKLMDIAHNIQEKANHFCILYHYDMDVKKTVELANEIKGMADSLAFITEKIAESAEENKSA